MKRKIFLGALCLPALIYAHGSLPKHCQALTVQGETVTIQAPKKGLVFVHNISENDLWITHPVADPSASAGWSTRLQKGKWSALAVDKGDFAINCIESRPGHEQQTLCEDSVAVCLWKKVKIPENQQGYFWVAEDLNLGALKAAVGARGYVLP